MIYFLYLGEKKTDISACAILAFLQYRIEHGSIASLYVIEAKGGVHGSATGREIGAVCRFRRTRCTDTTPTQRCGAAICH